MQALNRSRAELLSVFERMDNDEVKRDEIGGSVVSAQLLRQRYNRRFLGMDKYSDLRGWQIATSFTLQIVLAVIAGHYLIERVDAGWAIIPALGLTLFIGTRLRALNNIVHECSHSTFCRDRHQNALIGSFCSALTLGCFSDYRDKHLSHHAHLGDYERDLDFRGIEKLGVDDPLTRRTIVRHIITPLIGRHLPYYLYLNRSRRDGVAFVALKISLLISVLLVTFAAPQTALLFLVAPFVLVYSALNYWADCIDHAGLITGPDELDKSRNFRVPRPISLLFFPRNDCFHLVHHLFPQVPARHLEATHELLSQDEIYRTNKNACAGWKGFRNIDGARPTSNTLSQSTK
jgi:fatty acid desaturase